MTIIEYRKVQCDQCGKIEEVKESGTLPYNWFTVEICEWFGSTGEGRFNKEVCSEKCVIEMMNKIKKIPEKKETNIF